MIIEKVHFVDDAVKSMTKEEFIEKHKNVVWLNRKLKVRLKMLSDAYETITNKP